MARFLQRLFGGPQNAPNKAGLALMRSLRTFLQGVAGAFPSAGVGTVVLTAGYWETFGYSVIAAAVAGLVALIQNFAALLPE
jgi:hypothetical protein